MLVAAMDASFEQVDGLSDAYAGREQVPM